MNPAASDAWRSAALDYLRLAFHANHLDLAKAASKQRAELQNAADRLFCARESTPLLRQHDMQQPLDDGRNPS